MKNRAKPVVGIAAAACILILILAATGAGTLEKWLWMRQVGKGNQAGKMGGFRQSHGGAKNHPEPTCLKVKALSMGVWENTLICQAYLQANLVL